MKSLPPRSTDQRREELLSCFEARLFRPAVAEFAKRIAEITQKHDVTIIMARKAACFVECLRTVGLSAFQGIVVSDRVLDWDTRWLRGKRIAVIDDCVISGSTLYRIKRQLVQLDCKVSIHALAVDKEWFRKDLFKIERPYLRLKSEPLSGLCADVVDAIASLPMPYASDFPLFNGITVSFAEFRSMCAMPDYRYVETTSRHQSDHQARSFSVRMQPSAMKRLEADIGWTLPPGALAKLRITGVQSQEGFVLSVLPIVSLPPLTVEEVDALLRECLERFPQERAIIETALPPHDAGTFVRQAAAKAKLRLVTYWIGARVANAFERDVSTLLGKPLFPQIASRQNLAYLVPPHAVAATQHIADSIGAFWRNPGIPAEPHHGREHDNSAPWIYGDVRKSLDAHSLFGHLMQPFLNLYHKKELPTRELVLKRGAEILDPPAKETSGQKEFTGLLSELREYQKASNRLNEGFSFAEVVSWLDPVAPRIGSAHDIASRFLDEVVDRGYIVPITYCGRVKGGQELVYRAYRHGEDILFNQSTKAALSQMLEHLLKGRNLDGMASIRLTKSLALFLRAGLNVGILEEDRPPFARDCDQTLALRFWEHGVVPTVNADDEIAATPGKSLLNVLVSEGYLRTEGDVFKFRQRLNGGLRKVQEKRSAIFGRLLQKVTTATKTKGSLAFTNWELALAATCYTPQDTAMAMAAEIEVVRHRTAEEARSELYRIATTTPLHGMELNAEKLSNAADQLRSKALGIVTPLHSGIWKWRHLRNRRPDEIYDRMAKIFAEDLERDTWETYWPETHAQEADALSLRLPGVLDVTARWLLRFATQWTMLELLHRYAALEASEPGRAVRTLAELKPDESEQRQLPFGWEGNDEPPSPSIAVHEQRLIRCVLEAHGFGVAYAKINGEESHRLNQHLQHWLDLLKKPGVQLDDLRTKIKNRLQDMLEGPAEDVLKRVRIECTNLGHDEPLFSMPHILMFRCANRGKLAAWRSLAERLWREYQVDLTMGNVSLDDRPVILPDFDDSYGIGLAVGCTSSPVHLAAFIQLAAKRTKLVEESQILLFTSLPDEIAPFKRKFSSEFGASAFADYLRLFNSPRFPVRLPPSPGTFALVDFANRADPKFAESLGLALQTSSEVNPLDHPMLPLPRRFGVGTIQHQPATAVEITKAPRVDVAILTIVPTELQAVLAGLRRHGSAERKLVEPANRDYYLGTLPALTGSHRVVVGRSWRKGQESASAAFHAIDQAFHPRTIVLLGISGAVKPKQNLGDVAIGTEFLRYDFGEIVGAELLRRPEPWPDLEGWQHPLIERFENEYTDPAKLQGNTGEFTVRLGPIATGNWVVKSKEAEIREYLRRTAANTLVLEMEAAGFLSAYQESQRRTNEHPEGFFIVRGISDHADIQKDDAAQRICSENAFTCLEKILSMYCYENGRFRI